MIKKYHKGSKGSEGEYQKWEHFRVVKKFTILPLRIYQYYSQTTWWSWLETSYILQSWKIDSSIKSYLFGGYWKNERMSDIEEYNDYKNSKQNLNNMDKDNKNMELDNTDKKLNISDVIGSLSFDEVETFIGWIGCCNFKYSVKKHIWTKKSENLKLTSSELIDRFISNYR